MIAFVKLLAIFAIMYLSYLLIFSILKPISTNRKKKLRDILTEQKKQRRKEKLFYLKDVILRKIAQHVLLGENTREEYQILLDRLDIKKSPEEIRAFQILLFVLVSVFCGIIFSINPLIGFISFLGPFVAWLYPIDDMERKIQEKNKQVMADFPAFYSLLYYQYSRSVHIYLADVVRDFIPNANTDMAKELGIFLDNIENGEDFALKEFKKRIPLRYIIKFCDIMQIRINGYDNTAQMGYLKNELNQLRLQNLENELDAREKKNIRTQFTLVGILALYVIVYFYFQFISAIKLFS